MYTFLKVRDSASQQYKIMGKIIVLCIFRIGKEVYSYLTPSYSSSLISPSFSLPSLVSSHSLFLHIPGYNLFVKTTTHKPHRVTILERNINNNHFQFLFTF